jgi:hypothetical protein
MGSGLDESIYWYYRRQNTTEDRRQTEVRSEIFILCGVVTVTFRVLSRFVVTECYSHNKIVLQLIVVQQLFFKIKKSPRA